MTFSQRPRVSSRLVGLLVLAVASVALMGVSYDLRAEENFETIGFDDFEDGDHLDGDPLCWIQVGGAGTHQVLDGRLVVCADNRRNLILWGCHDVSGDVTVGVQARLGEGGKFYAVYAHAPTRTSTYTAQFGVLQGVVGASLLACTDGGGCKRLSEIALDPVQYSPYDDQILQLDIRDGRLEVRIWPPGEERPASALLAALDRTLTAGGVGIITRGCAEYEEFWVGTPAQDPPPQEFRRGDANRDAVVDISDAVATLIFLFAGGETGGCSDAADIDDSGHIDISDAVYLLNHLFTRGSPPPDPYPDCGVDPTPEDDLDCEEDSPCDEP